MTSPIDGLRKLIGPRPADLSRYRPWKPEDPTLDVSAQADWAWRPDPWRSRLATVRGDLTGGGIRLSPQVSLHRDGETGQVRFAQLVEAGGATAALRIELETAAYAGAFLSLAINLPIAACTGMAPHQMLVVALTRALPDGPHAHACLNLMRAPNRARCHASFPGNAAEQRLALDLSQVPGHMLPPDRAWLDLIFERPADARIVLTDVTLSRLPRPPF